MEPKNNDVSSIDFIVYPIEACNEVGIVGDFSFGIPEVKKED